MKTNNCMNGGTKLICLNCEWTGKKSDLVEIQYIPEDDYIIQGEMMQVCPKCKTPAWEEVS